MSGPVVCVAPWDTRRIPSPEEFWTRVQHRVHHAVKDRAHLILFPEYFALSWLLAHSSQHFRHALHAFPALSSEFFSRFAELASSSGVTIVAGTIPVNHQARLVNRCHIFMPDGNLLTQDKINMTRFESEEWDMSPGIDQRATFEVAGARFGVAICYDVEFPSYVEKLLLHDVDVLLVPSCTDDIHGYWRVRHCAQARAVEGQLYAVMAPLIGGDPAHPEIDAHVGRAGIFTPCDKHFPVQGILKLGEENNDTPISALLDIANIHTVRSTGTVLNRRDILSSG